MATFEKNSDGSTTRKLPEGFERIPSPSEFGQFSDISSPGQFGADPRAVFGKRIPTGDAPQVGQATPEAPTSPVDSFNLLLTNMLSKAQGVDSAGLKKKQRALQRASIGRVTAETPEELRTLSPAQQKAIRTGDLNALIPDIDENAFRLAKAKEATQNFEFAFNQARQLGEEFAKNVVAPDDIIDNYVMQIQADPDSMEALLNSMNNDKTRNKVVSKLDFAGMKATRDADDARGDAPSISDQLKAQEAGFDIVDRKIVKQETISDISQASVDDIANAIKTIESNNNFDAKGGSGEFGAYQFMPATWNAWSQEYLQSIGEAPQSLDPTPENQDAVAKFKIGQLQSQGNSPEQIASIWNSGNPDPNVAGTGVNSQGVRFDTPGYVDKFKNTLSSQIGTTGGTGNIEDLTPEQRTEGALLARQQFGTIKTELQIENFLNPILQRIANGENIDDIADSLRFAGQSSGFTGSLRGAAQQITSKLSDKVAQPILDRLDDVIATKNQGAVMEFLKKMAIDNAPGGSVEKQKIRGEERTLELVGEIAEELKKYEDLGGDTNIFAGTAQQVTQKIGEEGDPELARIANKIQVAVVNYRKAISGAAFNELEQIEYRGIFPSISNTAELNSAKMESLQDVFQGDVDFFYKFAMGTDNYNEIFKTPTSGTDSTQLTSGTTSSGLKFTIEE